MNTQTFLNTLKENQDRNLLFEYAPSLFVGANYHITEVKHVTIDSVDCGIQSDSWKETVVQLWESPKEIGKRDFMKVNKALQIFDKVGTMKPYNFDSELKIEYSNETFHSTQQFVKEIEVDNNNIIVKLTLDKTLCKANEKCGIVEETSNKFESSCCSPESACC